MGVAATDGLGEERGCTGVGRDWGPKGQSMGGSPNPESMSFL